MKRLAFCFVMALAVLYPVTTSADTVYQGPGLSGSATTALVRAFKVASFPGTMAPPFRLQPYVVMIYAGVGFFLVDFFSETTAAKTDVAVSATTGQVIWKTSEPKGWTGALGDPKEGIALPGVTAGEIIVAYEQARHDKISGLESGNFDVHFGPTPGGLFVTFSQPEGPRTALALPMPMPTLMPNCMGRCRDVTTMFVSVKHGRVSVAGMISI